MDVHGSNAAGTPVTSAGPAADEGQLRRCETLLQLNRPAEAAAALSVLFAHDPQNPSVCALFAQALLAVGEPARAAELARRAAALDPANEWPHRLASTAFMRLGHEEAALAEARLAVRLAPHEWRCFVQLAAVAMDRKDARSEAQAAAAEALRLAPYEGACHSVAGMVAAAAGRREQARESFHHALRINPQDSVTLNELGRLALTGRGPTGGAKLADAATGFAHAVRTDPTAAVSRRNLDLVIRSFLAKLAYFVFIDAFIVSHGLSHSSALAARLVPVAALSLPAFIAIRFFRRLAPQFRHFVFEECRRRPLHIPVLFGVVSVLATVISGLAPLPVRTTSAGVALATAVVCRVSLFARLQQSVQTAKKGTPQPVFSTGLLWCITVALITAAGLLMVAAFKVPGAGVRVGLAAAVFAVLAILVGRTIFARRGA